jgi:small subunit ribosomal protein S20
VANIKSQKKRNLQNEGRRIRNRSVRSSLKTAAKKATRAIEAGEAEASSLLRHASRSLDKAASSGVIHKRTAARRKSRLARSLARSGEQAPGS